MIKNFIFYSDPGHGWLKVHKNLLNELNISKEISTCSYARGDFAYLEEDCDASVFLKAYENKYGFKPKIKCYFGNKRSKIRWYDRYAA